MVVRAGADRRQHPRVRLPAMYTDVAAHVQDSSTPFEAASWHRGHVYDISLGGVRIELDQPLCSTGPVSLTLNLPGAEADIVANAEVVWTNDADDDPGPRRMALRFTSFRRPADQASLARYIRNSCPRAAAA